jgi:hypothetical protein
MQSHLDKWIIVRINSHESTHWRANRIAQNRMFNTLYRRVTGAKGPAVRRLIEELVNPEKKYTKIRKKCWKYLH